MLFSTLAEAARQGCERVAYVSRRSLPPLVFLARGFLFLVGLHCACLLCPQSALALGFSFDFDSSKKVFPYQPNFLEKLDFGPADTSVSVSFS
jgi:hypothetical protein